MLLPAKNEVARHLRRYRTWERVMLASPTDRAARDSFEASGYTLCVLMGKRCAREAVAAAERYLQTSLPAYLQEQGDRPQQEPTGKTRKDRAGKDRSRKDRSGKAAGKTRSGESRSATGGPPSGRRSTAEL
ncbi:DUF5133 domain-containing protein [Streptomyces sp. DSM 3412]|uniref:DUF5133 domain-containing protein n=1 Tax=Streptomyces gottesmaniae TaxID=3075518 RepID=A0ABU2ZCN7_9ACTN|nr:DUF5133 domain-containing protein [Streptomyces sp. DSM 3412]MDT0574363.1 DUF5133 domain-containing protein [Streptomyces sp. DSM 3412]